jgi:uncharacterized protein YukE
MSTRVDVDIDELERFAAQLQQFNQQLEQIAYGIDGHLQQLGSSWRDDQYAKFADEWHSAFSAVYRYIDQSAPEFVRYLKVKAAKLRDARG